VQVVVVAKSEPMKARHLVGSASFGPETLKVILQAFDDASNSIAPDIGGNPLAIEAARLRLAKVILAIAQEDRSNPEQLKLAALTLMAKDARTGAI
jgi:hypothetical protein